MSTDHDIWSRQLVGGLDGLPLTSVPVVPLPDDHPDVEFDTDMAALTRMERRLWIAARNEDGDPKPAIPEDELLCDFIPGADAELHLAVDMAAFELVADDIAKWVA